MANHCEPAEKWTTRKCIWVKRQMEAPVRVLREISGPRQIQTFPCREPQLRGIPRTKRHLLLHSRSREMAGEQDFG